MNTPVPSAAIQVREDTPISECVALMNERNVGSVLICSEDGSVAGIFTERDLMRNMNLIRDGGYWSFPVSSVMSRPVVTINLANLDQASELMLAHGFRHLPVIERLAEGDSRLQGIVSIRDVLRAMCAPKAHFGAPPTPPVPVSTLIRTRDPKFRDSFLRILHKLANHVEFISGGDAPTAQSLSVIDADGMTPLELAELVRSQLPVPAIRGIFVIHAPGALPVSALKALEELRSTRKFELFQKPLNLLALSDALGRMRIGQG